MRKLHTFLAGLGGADPDVLARAKQISKPGPAKDESRFVALGLVLLATAGLAVLSMNFAMTDGLHVNPASAVLVALAWGAIILIVDRALILSLKSKGSKWLLLGMILPRILMAALLGLVISTPLTLRIFHDEIRQQVVIDNIANAEKASADLSQGDRQKRLTALNQEIAKYEGYLAGNVPISSPEVVAAQNEYNQANADYQTKQADAETAWEAWKCELDGDFCAAGSGKEGDGPRAMALKRVYDRKEADASAAANLAQTKQNALTSAQATAKTQTGAKVAQAQAEANRVLPDLRNQRNDLQAAINGDLSNSGKAAAADTGLLAQLVALSHLGSKNGWARAAHLLVAALLFMLELLPVAIKTLSILGPPTAYDQIDDLDTKEVVRAAGRQDYIDKDLENRRKRIAEAVHDEVEEVMRDLATEQVKMWKQQVVQMTVAKQPGNGKTKGVGGGAASAANQRPTAAKITATLNLPPSAKYPT